MEKRLAIIKIDDMDFKGIVPKLLRQEIESKGIPEDLQVLRIDYEPTSASYFVKVSSSTFPIARYSTEIPIVLLEMTERKTKDGQLKGISFNLKNRV